MGAVGARGPCNPSGQGDFFPRSHSRGGAGSQLSPLAAQGSSGQPGQPSQGEPHPA